MSMNLQEKRALSDLSTFKVGGPARFYVEASSHEEVQEAFAFCTKKNIPYFILGRGSNCLFDDRGFSGLVLKLRIEHCKDRGDGLFDVGAGLSFSRLGTMTARGGWSGLEFASGIPGSVGGALYMNAGANGSEACDSLSEVDYLHSNGKLELFQRSQLEYSYRSSPFQGMRGCILSARFQCTIDQEARQRQRGIIAQRKESQPLNMPSAGCVFRNPNGASAGALIDTLGLKGLSVGDAEVSSKHANFIVNRGKASSQDVRVLIEQVQCRVREHAGYELETEIFSVPFEVE